MYSDFMVEIDDRSRANPGPEPKQGVVIKIPITCDALRVGQGLKPVSKAHPRQLRKPRPTPFLFSSADEYRPNVGELSPQHTEKGEPFFCRPKKTESFG